MRELLDPDVLVRRLAIKRLDELSIDANRSGVKRQREGELDRGPSWAGTVAACPQADAVIDLNSLTSYGGTRDWRSLEY